MCARTTRSLSHGDSLGTGEGLESGVENAHNRTRATSARQYLAGAVAPLNQKDRRSLGRFLGGGEGKLSFLDRNIPVNDNRRPKRGCWHTLGPARIAARHPQSNLILSMNGNEMTTVTPAIAPITIDVPPPFDPGGCSVGQSPAGYSLSLSLRTAMNAFWLISTLPIAFIRFLPSFCF
jgi:hypothetical protein